MKCYNNPAVTGCAMVLISALFAATVFGQDRAMANREALTRDLTKLAYRAQDYYHRAMSKGGGGGSFVGLTADASGISKLTSKLTNSNGTFCVIVAGTATSVGLQGIGTQRGNDGNAVEVEINVFADSTAFTYVN